MNTRQHKLKAWLRKRWLPVAVMLLGLTLLAMLALGNIRHFHGHTPIASIEPENRENMRKPGSRLERYQQEMEEISRQHARRQRSMEKIIGMDFGSMSGEEVLGKREEMPAPNDPTAEPTPEKSPALPVSNKTAVHINTRPGKSPQEKPATPPADPFYTVRAVAQDEDFAKHGFYRAVVHGDQRLQPNGTLSLRLLEEIVVGADRFPRNTLLYGKLSGTGGGRLKVRILSIGLVPVRMRVLDQDYEEGIAYKQDEPLPSAIAESSDDALNQLLHAMPYGGVAGGLAGLGRNIVRKSRKDRSVILADGYPLYVAMEL